jgi:hypothetical protein
MIFYEELFHQGQEKDKHVTGRMRGVADIAKWVRDNGLYVLIYGGTNSRTWRSLVLMSFAESPWLQRMDMSCALSRTFVRNSTRFLSRDMLGESSARFDGMSLPLGLPTSGPEDTGLLQRAALETLLFSSWSAGAFTRDSKLSRS